MNNKRVILLIDDEDEIRSVIAGSLRQRYDVIEMIEAKSAWIALQTGLRPDLIVSDLHLPGMTGHRLLANLRADPALASIPFVLTSADTDLADIAAGMSLPHYLRKPFAASELDRLADSLLGP